MAHLTPNGTRGTVRVNKPTDRTVFQNAWVVDDVETACMKWVNEMGVGPFFRH